MRRRAAPSADGAEQRGDAGRDEQRAADPDLALSRDVVLPSVRARAPEAGLRIPEPTAGGAPVRRHAARCPAIV